MIERKNRVQTIHPLSISRQCRLMSLHRSSYYYEAVETKDDEFILMRWIDELHIRRPFWAYAESPMNYKMLVVV